MTALSVQPGKTVSRWVAKLVDLTLTSGQSAFKGGAAALVLGTGKIVTATGAINQRWVGTFQKTTGGAVSADTAVSVDLERPRETVYFVNGNSIAATDIGKVCYLADDQTVTLVPGGAPFGVVWGVDSAQGVAVEPFGLGNPYNPIAAAAGTLAFAANDIVMTAAQAINGMVYDVPTTAAASTVTLPVTNVPDGTTIRFVADGTKNGHTVQYRFGATNITTALTASKIHGVTVTKLGTGWGVTGLNVSP